MEKLLVADNVSKSFGDYKALNDISIEVPKGSVFGLLGPNGAGKTTFIRIINQVTMPDSGMILLDGKPLQPDDIRYIGYLPEERGLYKSMKVGEQVLYLAQLKGLSKQEAKIRLKYWFDRLEIGDWWNKKIQELSKGMAQKIQFIVTVLHEPKLLIFDEPFSGFDPINANAIKDEILHLRDKGASIIFSTHRMESVEELCEYIALLHQSEKILDGRLSDIKKAYKNNIFNVGLETPNGAALLTEISEKFDVKTSEYDEFQKQLDLTLQLPTNDSAHLLNYLSNKANINNFVEKVPSANEIFIQTVQNKNGHE